MPPCSQMPKMQKLLEHQSLNLLCHPIFPRKCQEQQHTIGNALHANSILDQFLEGLSPRYTFLGQFVTLTIQSRSLSEAVKQTMSGNFCARTSRTDCRIPSKMIAIFCESLYICLCVHRRIFYPVSVSFFFAIIGKHDLIRLFDASCVAETTMVRHQCPFFRITQTRNDKSFFQSPGTCVTRNRDRSTVLS